MNTQPRIIKDLGQMYCSDLSKRKEHFYLFECNCGNTFKSRKYDVLNGKTKSCGCLNAKNATLRNTIHNESKTKLYSKWLSMKQRCFYEKGKSFKYYGGKGITICSEWKNDFNKFKTWAVLSGYKNDLEIDRIDNNGNYEPSNCRWVNRNIQNQNTSVIREGNTSGYKGVSFSKKSDKWVAQISINSSKKWIGQYKTPLHAALAYDTFIIVYGLKHTQNFNKAKA